MAGVIAEGREGIWETMGWLLRRVCSERAQITSMHTHGATPSDAAKLNLSEEREWIRILIRELQGGALTLRHQNKI